MKSYQKKKSYQQNNIVQGKSEPQKLFSSSSIPETINHQATSSAKVQLKTKSQWKNFGDIPLHPSSLRYPTIQKTGNTRETKQNTSVQRQSNINPLGYRIPREKHQRTNILTKPNSLLQRRRVDRSSDLKSTVPSNYIQRLSYNEQLDGCYSDVLLGQKVTKENAVVTASSNRGIGGGHSVVYIEKLHSDNTPTNYAIDLTYGGYSHGGSSSNTTGTTDSSSGTTDSNKSSSTKKEKGVDIRIQEGETFKKPRPSEKKRSWVIKSKNAEKILEKAKKIRSRQSTIGYTLFGTSLWSWFKRKLGFGKPQKKEMMNCAKFAETILNAGGIQVSAGDTFKLPNKLTSEKNLGHKMDPEYQKLIDQKVKDKQIFEHYRTSVLPGKHSVTFKPGKKLERLDFQGNSMGEYTVVDKTEDQISWMFNELPTQFDVRVEDYSYDNGMIETNRTGHMGNFYLKIQEVFDLNGKVLTE